MKKSTIGAIAVVALLASLSADGEVIFSDTFDTPSIPVGGVWDDLNSWDLASRQAAGTTGSTYTLGLASGQTLIGPAADSAGKVQPVLVRVNAAGGLGGATTLDLDTDFGSSLANTNWTLSYDGRLDANATYSGWTGFAVGNPANTPIDGGTALGFNIFPNGTYQVWTNGALAVSVPTGYAISGLNYTLTTTFDEVAGTAQITYSDGTIGDFDMGTFAISFVDGSRYVELKNSVDSSTSDGVIDWRVDNILIETIPEPATLGMFALLGGGILWVRKRFKS